MMRLGKLAAFQLAQSGVAGEKWDSGTILSVQNGNTLYCHINVDSSSFVALCHKTAFTSLTEKMPKQGL